MIDVTDPAPPRPPLPLGGESAPPRPPPPETDDEDEERFPVLDRSQPIMVRITLILSQVVMSKMFLLNATLMMF